MGERYAKHIDKDLVNHTNGGGPRKYTEDDIPTILEAIENNRGFKGRTAQALGITTGTLNKYIKEFPILQEKFDDVNAINVDQVHETVLDRIEEGAQGSHILAMFYLKAKGGWRDTTHIVQETHNFDWKGKLEEAAQHHPEIVEGSFVDDGEDYSGW